MTLSQTVTIVTQTVTTVAVIDVHCPHARCRRKLARTTAPLTKSVTLTCPRCREMVTVLV
jgi:hypothetical protein